MSADLLEEEGRAPALEFVSPRGGSGFEAGGEGGEESDTVTHDQSHADWRAPSQSNNQEDAHALPSQSEHTEIALPQEGEEEEDVLTSVFAEAGFPPSPYESRKSTRRKPFQGYPVFTGGEEVHELSSDSPPSPAHEPSNGKTDRVTSDNTATQAQEGRGHAPPSPDGAPPIG